MLGLLAAILTAFPGLGPPSRFPALGQDEAWALMPRENPTLPAWARVLVRSLPRATGAMLELDRLHRADNPLGPALAAKLRWLVGDSLGCEYARFTALADLKRAGATDAEAKQLTVGPPAEGDRDLFAFARQMTRAADQVKDADFSALLARFGPENMTAIVHTLAFANFQNRIILALGVMPEPGGAVPPVTVAFDASRRPKVATPARPPWEAVASARPKKNYDAPEDWKEISFEQLEQALAAQKDRKPRVAMPPKDRFENLPPDTKRQTDTIVWMTVSAGYQPKMTIAWFAGLREFQQESRLNRVFASSLFWVVTRANECFY